MNRHSKLPARFLLVLLGTILIAAGMASVALAREETQFHGPNEFVVLEATKTMAYFTVNESCGDIDENCTVIVRTSGELADGEFDGIEDDWAANLDYSPDPCPTSGNGENERNQDFDNW